MKIKLLLLFFVLPTGMLRADPIQIANVSEDTVFVRVAYGTADCDFVEWHNLCIAPSMAESVENWELSNPDLVPFAIRVWTNCLPEDWSEESWGVNTFLGCTGASFFDSYSIAWFEYISGTGASIWGANIAPF